VSVSPPLAPLQLRDDDQAIAAWLDTAHNRERSGSYDDLKLEPIRRVLAALPRAPAPVTIAGSKGKGSTVAFLEALLHAHGRRVCSFTSPHVSHLRERWRIDARPAAASLVRDACHQVAAAESQTATRLSYFERCFAIACVLAADQAAEDAVIFLCEVGIGGRLDCANALDARMVLLTSLGLDHCQILGNSLEAIAGEKLGVSRPGAPLLIAPQSEAAASAIGARMPATVTPTWVPTSDAWQLGMPGEHQHGNAAVALQAAELLLGALNHKRCAQALAATRLPGRCQRIDRPDGRRLLIDGAHNVDSLRATIRCASDTLRAPWSLIIGYALDKDLDALLSEIDGPASILRCGYDSPRARRADDWPAVARSWPWHDSLGEALATLPQQRDICITGSLYLAGEALALLDA